MAVHRTGPWSEVKAALGRSRREVAATLLLNSKQEAELAAKLMKKAIVTAGKSNGVPWPKLSPWTSLAKGHGRKLQDTKRLHASIKARPIGRKWVAGPDESQSYAGGMTLGDVTKIHEEGAKFWLEITHRMAALLAIRAKELGIKPKKGGKLSVGSQVLIVIPRRSFIEDTRKKHFGTLSVTKRFVKRSVASLGIVKFFKKHSR